MFFPEPPPDSPPPAGQNPPSVCPQNVRKVGVKFFGGGEGAEDGRVPQCVPLPPTPVGHGQPYWSPLIRLPDRWGTPAPTLPCGFDHRGLLSLDSVSAERGGGGGFPLSPAWLARPIPRLMAWLLRCIGAYMLSSQCPDPGSQVYPFPCSHSKRRHLRGHLVSLGAGFIKACQAVGVGEGVVVSL